LKTENKTEKLTTETDQILFLFSFYNVAGIVRRNAMYTT